MVLIVDKVPDREICITEDNETVLTYNYGESSLYPYIHPVCAPNGMIVTEGTQDTKQNRLPGLSFSIGSIKDQNGNPLSLERPAIELDREFIKTSKSDQSTKIISQTTWKEHESVLIETFEINVKPGKNDVRILDIEVGLQAKSKPIAFGHNIGLSYSAVEMEHRKTANADGKIGQAEVNKQESAWGTLCGILTNTAIGVAICPHPTNGITEFLAEDTYQGTLFAEVSSFTLTTDERRLLRYRVLIYLGDLYTFNVEEYYAKYCI